MISKKDFNQTKANQKSAQGERIFVTDKNERKQNHNKMENNQNTFSVEVSARGQVTANNRARLKALAYRCCRDAKIVTNSLIKNGSKAALLTSFSIFSARNEPSWIDPPPLIAR